MSRGEDGVSTIFGMEFITKALTSNPHTFRVHAHFFTNKNIHQEGKIVMKRQNKIIAFLFSNSKNDSFVNKIILL